MSTFTITAAHTSPAFQGQRIELYFGEKKTPGATKKHAETTLERLKKKHGSSFTDYRIEPTSTA